MPMKRYEYDIKHPNGETYKGSYTIKANCPKEKELQKQFNSKLVQEFEH